ncbi:MAG TPA: S9 family peptidase [Roseiflexaceae bacterium]|nr:S9 family peptidase [Roseiflexaceae bacterium]
MPTYDFARFLNIRSAYGSSFAPDGRKIAFLSNITGVPQVWQVSAGEGWPEQLTFFSERVSFVEYARTAERAVFGMDTGGSERTQLYLLTAGGAESLSLTAEAPEAIHTFGGWSPDGQQIAFSSNRRSSAHFDVYVRPVGPRGEGEARLVFEGQGTFHPLAWGPQGDWLIVTHARGPLDNPLLLLRLDGSAPEPLTPEAGSARYAFVQATPDGRGLYLATDRDSEFLRAAYLDLQTRELRFLTADNWDVDLLALSPDGRALAVALNDQGYSRWWLRDLAAGRDLPGPELPPGVCSLAAFAPDSSALTFSLTGPQHPFDVWVHALSGGTRRVTSSSLAGIPRETLVQPDPLHYPSFDGRTIPAYLYRPHGVGIGAPVIVDVHGGPESQRRVEFNAVYQYFLHRGFAILAPNVRGSTGYGRTYTHLDDVEKRMDSVADLAHAVHWLRDSGVAGGARIAVMGGSYGGFMVLAALTSYPDLWAAGVDIVGIANFVTFLEHTGPWRRHLREVEYGSLERDRDFLESISPIHKVDQIRAPLLVIHGANDPRVPVGEAEQIVASLRERGAPVEYLRFEDEGHGIVKLANRLVCYPAIAEFLDGVLRS